MKNYFDIALIIISVSLILSVILTGADMGSVFTTRRGIERVLFWITIGLSVLFFALVLFVIKFPG